MPLDLARLLQMAPGIAAGALGNPGGGGAFMQGLEEGRQIRLREQMLQQQQGRQSELDASRLQTEEAQRQNLTADNARAEAAAKQQKLMQALAMLDKFSGQVAETAVDPVAAENQVLGRAAAVESMFGVPQGQLSAAVPNMAAPVSRRRQKLAETIYAKAEKEFGREALANDSITLLGTELGDMKPSQLREMFGMKAVTQAGTPAAPMVPDPEAKSGGSFDAQFADVLAGEEAKLGRKLTREERARLRLKEKSSYDAAGRDPTGGPVGALAAEMAGLRADLLREQVRKATDEATKGTAGERVAGSYYNRATKSDTIAKTFEDGLSSLGAQAELVFPNLMQSDVGQRYIQAQRQFTEARLRKESGAAIPPSEFVNDAKTYFAQVGDKPATIAQKQMARQAVIDGLQLQSGPAGEALVKPMPSHDQGVTVTTPNGQTFTFPTPEAAAAFRKEAGIK